MNCPTPWKPAHPSPQAAFKAAGPDQEHYHCHPGCGAWHVTTSPRKRARNAAKASAAEYRRSWKARRKIRKQFGRTGRQRTE